MTHMIGKLISHYRILELLGEGGMGTVYKAEDLKLKRVVAIKFLSREALGEKAKMRFIQEAQATATLNHPNICTIYEIDESEGQPFIVMEFIEGQNLSDRLEEGPLSLDEALDIATQVSEGLQEAHDKGIIHRDIKSANIMLTEQGRAKIMDFGLAKLAARRTRLTSTGATVGTAYYMSPEQATGEHADHRTDIWSLGVVLYEMLTGELPFKGDYHPAVLYAIMNEEPEPIKNIPDTLQKIILKLLQKDVSERFQHMNEFLTSLHMFGRQLGVEELTTDFLEKAGKSSSTRGLPFYRQLLQRKRFLYVLAGILILFLSGIAIRIIWQNKEEHFRGVNGVKPGKLVIVVMNFDNNTGDSGLDWLSRGIPDMLITDLGRSEYVRIISTEQITDMLGGVRKDKEFAIDRATTVEVGKRAKAQIAVTGSIIKSGNVIRITAQLVDLATNVLISTAVVKGTGLGRLIEMVDQLSVKIRLALEIEASGVPEVARGITQTKTSFVEAYKYYVLGRESVYKRYYEDAIANLRKAIEIDSGFAYAYSLLANVYDVLGETSMAEDAINLAIKHSKKFPQVDRLRILLRQAQIKGDWNSELEYLKQLVVLEPYEAEWHFKLGWHYGTHKRLFEQSILEYKKAIEIDSVTQPRYYYYLGYAYLNWGKPGMAIQTLKTYASLLPGEASSHEALAAVYLLAGHYDKAYNEFKTALETKQNFAPTLASLGDLYFVKGMYDEALSYYQRYLASTVTKQHQKYGHFYLARLYLETEELEKAEEEIKSALGLDTNMLEAQWILGLIALEKGKTDSAEAISKRMRQKLSALQTHYREQYYHHLKGKLYQKRGRFNLAVNEFQQAVNLGPLERAFFLNALAEAYFASGDLDKAIETCNRVFEFNPNYAKAHYMLARVYEQKGEPKKALQEYERFLQIWQDAQEEIASVEESKHKIRMLKKK